MAWNEPGGSGDKDPWGRRNDEQGPPDLDEVLKKLQQKFGGLFGGGGRGGRAGGSGGGGMSLSIILAGLLVVWALSGIYIVKEGMQGVILQFGAFKGIAGPGPHWYPRFIQSVEIVDMNQVRSVNLGRVPDEALMLTQDENIIDIKFTVQYNINDAREYLFDVRDPDLTLRQATESAVREIVGKNTLDFIITEGRTQVAADAQRLIQQILDGYKTGITVIKLNMQDAQPPQQVKAAFDDATKAREDRVRQVNEAQAYANDVLPKARGRAARMVQEAEAYRAEVVSIAQGETRRFSQILSQYRKAPKVTRERLYLETMEEVLGKTGKILVDVKQGNNLIYLPIDKLEGARKGRALNETPLDAMQVAPGPDSTAGSPGTRLRDRLRTREVR